MPANPGLRTNIDTSYSNTRFDGATDATVQEHQAMLDAQNTLLNAIYKLTSDGAARTASFTVAQGDQAEFIRADHATVAIVVTVPVLEQGTIMQVGRKGAAAVTFTASGTTFILPTGRTASIGLVGGIVGLYWATTTEVWLSGELT